MEPIVDRLCIAQPFKGDAMQYIELVKRDADGNIQEGIRFWWAEGEHSYLYQRWEHKGSGPIWGAVNPDPVLTDLNTTVRECWGNWELLASNMDYR
jgi:hypothetical protein